MEWLLAAGERAGHRRLQGQAVPRDRVRVEGLVGGTPRHVGHVLVGALLGPGTAAERRRREHREEQGAGANHHASASFTWTSRAPQPSRSSRTRETSRKLSRLRRARAKTSAVIPSASSRSALPGWSRARKKRAPTVESAATSMVISKETGTKASVELSGLPPTLSGQSQTAV